MDNAKLCITIETRTEEEKMEVAMKIHNQLSGNQDYIDSNILLNISLERKVRLWIFDECVDVPEITI